MPRPDLLERFRRALIPIIAAVADDPRKLKPGQTLRLLNGTPLGAILTEPQLRRHRQEAGSRIGDGRTIDLIRYAGWLADRRRRQTQAETISPETVQRRPAAEPTPAEAYDAQKERARNRNAANSRSGRNIGGIRDVADPPRREKCLADPERFYRVYFPERFPLPFSKPHVRLIGDLERTIREGGLKAFAMPRGSGKTTLCEAAVIRSVLLGHRKFVVLVGASNDSAISSLDSLKSEFETNPFLLADFPEVCQPIEELEGIYNRCKGQMYTTRDGATARTHVRWSGRTLVLPMTEANPAAGAMITVRGILGAIRGMKFARPCDGQNVRPDLVIIDDPQTDTSAQSDSQCDKRIKVIEGSILGLAGPGKEIAACCPCTIIRGNDVADRLLNQDLFPDWHGETFSLIPKMPTNLEAWDAYAEVRRQELRAGGQGTKANAHFRKHRKTLEQGAEVMWAERKNTKDVSALQHAMNLLIDRPATFHAEYQNAPKRAETTTLAPVDVLRGKGNGLERGVAPTGTTRITAFIDVQHSLLYWMACAWTPGLGGAILDYGTWPEQSQSYFTLRQARLRLKGATPAAAVTAGLEQLLGRLQSRIWRREDGSDQATDLVLVDHADGTMQDAMLALVRRLVSEGYRVQPAFGRGIGPNERPMSEWKTEPGRILGDHWISDVNKLRMRQVTVDVNFWKEQVHRGLAAPLGTAQAITLWGNRQTDHAMLFDHLHAETCDLITSQKSGRTVPVFRAKPGKPDNHLLDDLVGCAVGASLLGCVRADLPSMHKPKLRQPTPPVDDSHDERVTYL